MKVDHRTPKVWWYVYTFDYPSALFLNPAKPSRPEPNNQAAAGMGVGVGISTILPLAILVLVKPFEEALGVAIKERLKPSELAEFTGMPK